MPLWTILTKWPGRSFTNMSGARFAIDFRRRSFEDRADVLIHCRITSDHDTRPVPRTFLSAGNADAEKCDPGLSEILPRGVPCQ